ncbi:MAG: type II secretion system inner membrane protein GspF [Myxococcales bacterium]|nr:type II secretion system inner membrane protein GspF [Myxococcales bacterium]
MPVYEYRGLSTKGKQVRGVFDAENPRALRTALKRQEIYLTEFVEQNASGSDRGAARKANITEAAVTSREIDFRKYFQRVRKMDVAIATRQLATLLRAGIPMVESLNAIIDQTEQEKFKAIITQVRKAVNEGSSLANALVEHKAIFGDLYVNMIRAGETSGTLDLVCSRLADFTESQVEMRSKLVGAMMYPVIMVIVAVSIVTLLMVFLVPKMVEMFEMLGSEIPLMTRILIGISGFIGSWWWLLIMLFAGSVYGFRKWKETDGGRVRWDGFTLKVPVFGKLLRMIAVARFSRTLGTLLKSGVPVLNAMTIVNNIVTNRVLNKVIEEARDSIKEGESIAAPLKRSGQFPPLMTHMIAIGEKSGHLEEMLENVAGAYETEVESRISAMTSILTPLIIVFMGIVVALLAMSFLLPMLKMNEAIGG